MNAFIKTFKVLFLLLMLSLTIYGAAAFPTPIYNGNSVYVNDSTVYLQATPHTTTSGYVNLTLQSKVFTGDATLVLLYNNEQFIPTGLSLYNPTLITYNYSYTCPAGYTFGYTTNPKRAWCIAVNGTVVFNQSFNTGDLGSRTVFWTNQVLEDYPNRLNIDATIIPVNFQGNNRLAFVDDLPIVEDMIYRARLDLQVRQNAFIKYWVCIYPSSYGRNVQTANYNGHLYCLDPYATGTDSYYRLNNDYTDFFNNSDGAGLGNPVFTTDSYAIFNTSGNGSTHSWQGDGNGDFINTGVPTLSGGSWTIGAWFNSTDTTDSRKFFGEYGSGGMFLRTGGAGDNPDANDYDDLVIYANPCGATYKTNVGIHDGNYHMVVLVYNQSATDLFLYIDGLLYASDTSCTDDYTSQAGHNVSFGAWDDSPDNTEWAGNIDEAFIMFSALSPAEIAYYYNFGLVNFTTPAPAANTTYLDVTAKDTYDNTSIYNFSVTVNGTTYNTLNGSITTNISQSAGAIVNITFFSNQTGGFYNQTYLNYNSSMDIQVNTTKLYSLFGTTVNNYKIYNNYNYTNNATFNFSYTCPSFYSADIIVLFNNTYLRRIPLTCNNATVKTSLYNYTPTIEGNFTLGLLFNTSYIQFFNNKTAASKFLTADLNAPTVTLLNFTIPNGFFISGSNVSMSCYDTIMPEIEYNLTFNNISQVLQNATNNITLSNLTTLIDGNNTLIATCSDLFYNDTDTLIGNVFVKSFVLINEVTGGVFNASNLSSTRVYFDDNNTYFDFKLNKTAYLNFTGTLTDKLRFEFIDDGTNGNDETVNRYIDLSLVGNDTRICANLNDVVHNEQLIYSASEKVVVVKSIYANCLVTADYTRFAYQDTFLLKFFTIDRNYYLYTYDEGARVFLSGLDGSIPSTINLDVLEFNKDSFNLNLLQSSLSFKKTGATQVTIYYRNYDLTTTGLSVQITNMDDNSLVFNSTSFTNLTHVQIVFDYAALTVNESTLFKVVVVNTNPTGDTTIKKYFNINGSAGSLSAGFAVAMSLLLVLFGFTFATVRVVFSWFGVFIIIGAMALLAFAVQEWYVLFLEGIYAIVLIYVGIIMFKQNENTLT